jgi:hypothetical protein
LVVRTTPDDQRWPFWCANRALTSKITNYGWSIRLISSEAFSTGVLSLVYGPAESPGDATYEDAKVHLSQPGQ